MLEVQMKRTILGYVKNKNDPSINLFPWNKEYKKKFKDILDKVVILFLVCGLLFAVTLV
jgi:hypothetical protein